MKHGVVVVVVGVAAAAAAAEAAVSINKSIRIFFHSALSDNIHCTDH